MTFDLKGSYTLRVYLLSTLFVYFAARPTFPSAFNQVAGSASAIFGIHVAHDDAFDNVRLVKSFPGSEAFFKILRAWVSMAPNLIWVTVRIPPTGRSSMTPNEIMKKLQAW